MFHEVVATWEINTFHIEVCVPILLIYRLINAQSSDECEYLDKSRRTGILLDNVVVRIGEDECNVE